MAEEYWESSLFGKNSIFYPSWDEKQQQERAQQEKIRITGMSIIKNPNNDPIATFLQNSDTKYVSVILSIYVEGEVSRISAECNNLQINDIRLVEIKGTSREYKAIVRLPIPYAKASMRGYNKKDFVFTAKVVGRYGVATDSHTETYRADTNEVLKKQTLDDKCECKDEITETQLKLIAPVATSANINKHLSGLNLVMSKDKTNSCLRKIHFLAQVLHESGSLNYTKEIGVSDSSYGGFPGRGLIQLTGKDNYLGYQKYSGVDVTSTLENKKKLENSPDASLSAGWFWMKKNLDFYADNNDLIMITRLINGGFNGYNDRLKFVVKGIGTLAKTCQNISTNYQFSRSAVYTDIMGCFAWGLWHDPDLDKKGCTKNKQNAIEGYEQFLNIIPDDYEEFNKYGIKNIPAFENIKENGLVNIKTAAELRLSELKK